MEDTTWITEDVLLLYEAQWWRRYTCVNMVREKVMQDKKCDYSHNVVNLYSTVFKLNLWVNITIYNVLYNDAEHLHEQFKHLLEKYW